MNPSVPPDANPEPLPIGLTDMWRIARKTYRAERRYYLKLDRHRKMTSKRLASSDLPLAQALDLHHRRGPLRYHLPGRLHRPPAGGDLPPRAARHQGRRPLRLRGPLELPSLARVLPPRLPLAGARRARRRPALREKTPTNIFLIPFLAKAFPDCAVHPHHPRRSRRLQLAHAQALAARRGRLVGRARARRLPPRPLAQLLGGAGPPRRVPADQRCPPHGLGLAALHRGRPARRARPGARALPRAALRGPRARAGRRGRAGSSTSSDIKRQKSRDAFISATMRADDSSVGTWRSTFYPSELAEIDAEAGDLLRQLGYDDD